MNKIIVVIIGAIVMINNVTITATPNAKAEAKQQSKVATSVSEPCAEIQAIRMIAKYESFQSDWYRCSANSRTIGYGFTESVLTPEEQKIKKMTRQQADRILGREVRKILKQIKPLITAKISEKQRAACVSLVWNIGLPSFKNSTFLKRINANDTNARIIAALEMWNKISVKNKVTGKMELVVCQGLVNRRASEAKAWKD